MTAVLNEQRQQANRKTKPPVNPLVRGILAFCKQNPPPGDHKFSEGQQNDQLGLEPSDNNDHSKLARELAISDIPKRFTIYPPVLLLPYNYPVHSPRWTELYGSLDEDQKQELFRCIAEDGFRKLGISKIAINAPIAAETEGTSDVEDELNQLRISDGCSCEAEVICSPDATPPAVEKEPEQNVLRSPSGLVPVYGDWGPSYPSDRHKSRILNPTAQDLDEAFWTSTSQHQGITQVWAPLYTMFSRGNVSEKARILGVRSSFPGLTASELGDGEEIENIDVVDFYVGIGYFAFSYLKKGVRRVYGWDINPWSIEGLRRGCEKNGWGCMVVRVADDGNVEGRRGVRALAERIREGDVDGREEKVVRCVAFLGDNQWAAKVLNELQLELNRMDSVRWLKRQELNVRHTNLGLLPTSKASWRNAVGILTGLSKRGRGGWMHVHENFDIRKIDDMVWEVVDELNGLARACSGGCVFDVSCVHLQRVKTYAPGVMHCVIDIAIKANG